jgi:predicted TPR repeat methyltransferase
MSTVPYRESHQGRGPDYDESFSPEVNPHRAMVWRLEQRVLDRIWRDYLDARRVSHLDFACGTGRILRHFVGRVTHATGVDVASSMLEVARKVVPAAELIEADLTQANVLDGRRFDLITAFRFFPNAEPELRRAVFSVLARHLAPQGVLILNNHKNRNSLRRRLSGLLGRAVSRGTMTHGQVHALAAEAGLRVLQVIPIACLPVSDRHLPLPIWLLESLERRMSRLPGAAALAHNVIYVCTHREVGGSSDA